MAPGDGVDSPHHLGELGPMSAIRPRFFIVTAAAVFVAIAGHLYLENTLGLSDDIGSVGAFVTAVGTLYSVLTAFTVVSVWTEFTDTDRSIKREARELSELWRYVGYVSDEAGASRARVAIERYRDEVINTEWPAMEAGLSADAADDEFFEMADAVNAIEVKTSRDVPAWAEAVRTLGEVSDARAERIVLVQLRMPRLLRILLYMATVTLISGASLLGFSSELIGGAVIAFTVMVSLLVLEVIDDIDDPFGGAWGVSAVPFARARFTTAGATK
jgi:hypothetical protein